MRSDTDTDPDPARGDAAREQAREQEAVRLGRFFPLGMLGGAAGGVLAGAVTRRFDVCVPVGVAAGILLAGTLPVFLRRRRRPHAAD